MECKSYRTTRKKLDNELLEMGLLLRKWRGGDYLVYDIETNSLVASMETLDEVKKWKEQEARNKRLLELLKEVKEENMDATLGMLSALFRTMLTIQEGAKLNHDEETEVN